ncbi:50S ribosomal protein L9 [Dioscorea cayenensis subsp. rotundata]|uniref:Large ribosomal subunit protein bL9c n=1 Tax=Dioscorea cayennensis subsp. rotundata TaxID=55577 RepID=A0AB40BFQ4_DIOCR|nr:50S ribosomal protein L9 [Dioscorea cayenensis subsp. rotundata]
MASALRHLAGNHSSVCITNPFLFAIQGLRYRKLEVILTTNIEKLGKAGETVKVAPGHFRNHLMPKLLAVPNINKYAFLIREQRKLYQCEEVETLAEVPKTEDTDATAMKMEDKMKEYQAAANQLDKARLGLRRLIKVDNELRSPVTKEELVAEVARQLCISIHPDNLHLPSPLTSLGEYEIPLRLPRSIPRPEGKLQWTLNVKIRRK